MWIRLMAATTCYLAILSGCSIDSFGQAQTWIGQNVERLIVHWGPPTSERALESSGGRLLTYSEVVEDVGQDNRLLCKELGLGSGWAELCNSEGKTFQSECVVNVATTADGIITEIAIVRDIRGHMVSICSRIIKARRQA